ncbi:hypothetical protein ACFXKR_36810 [Streptomyces violascens]|uniref:hypothetical protein n=1 Tax=Streptomyces violascens TaxID=67381 RepID=UPI0036CAC4C9
MSGVAVAGERVHRWQVGLAAGAVLATLPWLALGIHVTLVVVLFVFCGLPVAVPLLVLHRGEAFVRACVGIGLTSVLLAVVGFMLGLFVLLPSAVLLLVAAGADPRRRPVGARILGVAGALLALGATVVVPTWLVRDLVMAPSFAEPHTYRAVLDPEDRRYEYGLADAQETLRGFGATDVVELSGGGTHYLEVEFPEGLSQQRRAQLKSMTARLPGVEKVEVCPASDCG